MKHASKEVYQMFAGLVADFHRTELLREKSNAQADPLAHKKSRVFVGKTNYRYYSGGRNKKGQSVNFCYSTGRNVAGFFLGWRETVRKNGSVKRDMWLSRRVRKRCVEVAKRRSEAFKIRQAAKAAPAV